MISRSRQIRGTVLIVGPDGSGKSTIADAVAERLGIAGVLVVRGHGRPGNLLSKANNGVANTEPHATHPRGAVASSLKLVLGFVELHVAAIGRWGNAARSGVLILERGWFDQVVDPVRYRLNRRIARVAELVGDIVPRADVVAVLHGDPALVRARKPELSIDEIDRQTHVWRRLAKRAGKRVVVLDTVRESPAICATRVLDELQSASDPHEWRSGALAPTRVDLRLRPGPSSHAALGIYRPLRSRSLWAAHANRGLLAAGLWRKTSAPVEGLEDFARTIGIEADAIASIASSGPSRTVIGFAARGKLVAVAKLGPLDDAGLRREAETLHALGSQRRMFAVPRIRWCGVWRGYYALACDALTVIDDTPAGMEQALQTAIALAHPRHRNGSITHGDFAPWNLISTSGVPAIIDWEEARTPCEPLFDLAHFVVQSGSLLKKFTPQTAVRLLTEPDSYGCRYLEAVGLRPTDGRVLLRNYLERRAPGSDERTARRFRQTMIEVLGPAA